MDPGQSTLSLLVCVCVMLAVGSRVQRADGKSTLNLLSRWVSQMQTLDAMLHNVYRSKTFPATYHFPAGLKIKTCDFCSIVIDWFTGIQETNLDYFWGTLQSGDVFRDQWSQMNGVVKEWHSISYVIKLFCNEVMILMFRLLSLQVLCHFCGLYQWINRLYWLLSTLSHSTLFL